MSPYNVGASLEARIGILIKWLLVIAMFMCIIMPAQLIWFFIYPFAKKWAKKQSEKTGVPVHLESTTPIDLYGKWAKRWLVGEF